MKRNTPVWDMVPSYHGFHQQTPGWSLCFYPEAFPSSDAGRPAIHCITWGPTTIHCTILYYPTLPFTSFDYMTTGQCIASHYLTLNRISCIASHDITAPYLKQPRKKKHKNKKDSAFPLQKTTLLFCFFRERWGKKTNPFPLEKLFVVPLEWGWHRCRSPQSVWLARGSSWKHQ